MSVASTQLHGFSDASEAAYAGVVYLRMVDSEGGVHVSLVMSNTKVAPIKRLTVPRLELCGAKLLAELLHHVKGVLDTPPSLVFSWTDSTEWCWVGCMGILGDLRLSSAIAYRPLRILFHQIAGAMSVAWRTRWIVHREDCSILSYSSTDCGGTVQRGFTNLNPVGL